MDRDIVSELSEPKVDVVASKKAVTVEMRSDNDPTFKWDVIMGIDSSSRSSLTNTSYSTRRDSTGLLCLQTLLPEPSSQGASQSSSC